ncbi:hypothetical protein CAPTEDRAFT_92249 [Capitella teleta]|uniref:Uncharacterized protein n=1 Tax=Capitella teleta TaxID=283909 RepID=R7UHY0_CAPTE|nr:hypothetical protein CAPTEDRAFT_92249 [Capitella teleta]|eukprot:ELU05820.1 hypothetical protein CAPTEDRAFT_92249 [Capitella teleta]
MERDPSQVLDSILQVEGLAEDILVDRQQIVDLDRKRQQTRQAIRALSKENSDDKSWVCFGNMFLKLQNSRAGNLLKKDFNELDEEINETRNQLKMKVNKLRDAENKDDIKGFSLQPLTKEEMHAINGVL